MSEVILSLFELSQNLYHQQPDTQSLHLYRLLMAWCGWHSFWQSKITFIYPFIFCHLKYLLFNGEIIKRKTKTSCQWMWECLVMGFYWILMEHPDWHWRELMRDWEERISRCVFGDFFCKIIPIYWIIGADINISFSFISMPFNLVGVVNISFLDMIFWLWWDTEQSHNLIIPTELSDLSYLKTLF